MEVPGAVLTSSSRIVILSLKDIQQLCKNFYSSREEAGNISEAFAFASSGLFLC